MTKEKPEAEAEAEEGKGPGALYLRKFANRLSQILIQGSRSDYDLGRMIEECLAGRYWRWWAWQDADGNDRVGFPTFDRWCWIMLGFKGRKAYMLRQNYQTLSVLDFDEEGVDFSRCLRIGWAKLNAIARVARDQAAMRAWLDEIERENLTYDELRAKVRWAIAEASGKGSGDAAPGAEGTEDGDGAAENSENVAIKWPVVFESREATEVVLKAHARIQIQYGSEIGLGRAMAMMATHYLATTQREDEGGAAVSAEYMIRQFEENYGVSVVPATDVASAAGLTADAEDPAAVALRRRRRRVV